MSDFWDEVYAKTRNSAQSPHTAALHDTVRSIIPADVATILDAGCGGGALMVVLAAEGKYAIQGVDQSAEGVRFIVEEMRMDAQVGDVTDLSRFPDNSCDLVVCSEVLEHLPPHLLDAAVKELCRVAAKYVILTNPFREKLEYHQLRCEHCRARFHVCGHLHSMDEAMMLSLASPWAKSVTFHYSGRRPYESVWYAGILRAAGCSVIQAETCCPLCGTPASYRTWGIFARLAGVLYRGMQNTLRRFGIYRPANIITFITVNG